ncbi:MAG: hypothetical protein Q8Q09_25410 [Deltaproteobacteria bacterium]|nr:hypothetical protein [Deltaproteobacteria bacterium]
MTETLYSRRRRVDLAGEFRAPRAVVLARDEGLLLCANARAGDSVYFTVGSHRGEAMQVTHDGAVAMEVDTDASTRTYAWVTLWSENSHGRQALGAVYVSTARALVWSRWIFALATLPAVLLAAISLLPAGRVAVAVPSWLASLVCASVLAIGARRRAGRWVHGGVVQVPAAVLALGLSLSAWGVVRSINHVVIESGVDTAHIAAISRSDLSRENNARSCGDGLAGGLCISRDPALFEHASCGPSVPRWWLGAAIATRHWRGCLRRFEALDADVAPMGIGCTPGAMGQCCVDLRGPSCEAPRTLSLDVRWRAGFERPTIGQGACATQSLVAWRAVVTAREGIGAAIARIARVPAQGELCLDLEGWGSVTAVSFVDERGAVQWRAQRSLPLRASAMRVRMPSVLPTQLNIELALGHSDQSVGRVQRLAIPWSMDTVRPTQLHFVAGREAEPASLDRVTLGDRAPRANPELHLLWPQGGPRVRTALPSRLACGQGVRLWRPGGEALSRVEVGETSLACARPASAESRNLPWIVHRFDATELQYHGGSLWADMQRRRLVARSVGADAARELFVSTRGAHVLDGNARFVDDAGRALGLVTTGDGHWRLRADPADPVEILCCELDGLWADCPLDVTYAWRCGPKLTNRPNCARAYADCTQSR